VGVGTDTLLGQPVGLCVRPGESGADQAARLGRCGGLGCGSGANEAELVYCPRLKCPFSDSSLTPKAFLFLFCHFYSMLWSPMCMYLCTKQVHTLNGGLLGSKGREAIPRVGTRLFD
jgi:hypothetical protein